MVSFDTRSFFVSFLRNFLSGLLLGVMGSDVWIGFIENAGIGFEAIPMAVWSLFVVLWNPDGEFTCAQLLCRSCT